MPRGGTWGVLWGMRGSKKFFYPKFNQIKCVHRHNFLGPQPLEPWGGVKILFSEHGHVAYQIKGDEQ